MYIHTTSIFPIRIDWKKYMYLMAHLPTHPFLYEGVKAKHKSAVRGSTSRKCPAGIIFIKC